MGSVLQRTALVHQTRGCSNSWVDVQVLMTVCLRYGGTTQKRGDKCKVSGEYSQSQTETSNMKAKRKEQ